MSNGNIKPFPLQGRARTIKRGLRNDPWWLKLLALLMILLIVIGIVALCVGLGAAIVLLAWNVGVKSIVSASGGSVGNISLLDAVGVSFALNVLRRPKIATKA